MAERVVLVDGSSLIYRAFFAIPQNFRTSSGVPTNATYGFAIMFRKILGGKRPAFGAVVFDAPGKTFRDEKFPAYKAQRPRMDPQLKAQIPWIHRVVETIRSEAARYGVSIAGTELIGPIPLDAMEEIFKFYLQCHDFHIEQVLETALLDD